MKVFSMNSIKNVLVVFKIILVLILSVFWSTSASADVSPAGCTGSGLGINLFTNLAVANIGDTISYSVVVFNGLSGGPVVCDATGITASLVTPDGVNHPITLTRTVLSDGQFDTYTNVVTYTARAADITTDGTLKATASDTGVIHQNITDSQGGGNQGLNVFVLNTLRVVKLVVNNNGGTATASGFTVHVKNAGTDVSGSPASGTGAPGTLYSLIAGTYIVSEDTNTSYTRSFSGDCDANGSVTLLGSDNKICTITNTDTASTIPPTAPTTRLHFLKRMCPSYSVLAGNARAGNFDNTGGHFTEFTNYSASATPNFPATYSPKPVNPAEVVASCLPSADWNFRLSTDEAQTLNMTTVGPTDATGEVIVPFSSLTVAQQNALTSGNKLWVSENPQSAFPFAALRCYNDANNGDNIEFISFSGPAPEDVYCIAYNIGSAPPTLPLSSTINVVKVVVNDNGGAKTIADFPLFVNGAPVVSGVTNTFAANASYTVTETADSNYTQTFSGDCNSSGQLGLVAGDVKVCVVTNDDVVPAVVTPPSGGGGGSTRIVPPLIDVVKVPDPLTLPGGPGPVTYTYTLRNIGTVPVTDITMVGDSCSPIILTSGDTDGDSRLDIDETWIYTCSTNLTATHTNTVTATGLANDISGVDIASATVIVGVPGFPDTGGSGGGGLTPPLIHVTKVPSLLALTFGGGTVTYTNIVTNPGAVALSNVFLKDDKCSPVNYISGDTDGDSKLDTTEAWVYTCLTRLSKTTTNTIVAEGDANGMRARDFAVATVVVPIPGLPNTGFPPVRAGTVIILIAILAAASNLFLVFRRKRAV